MVITANDPFLVPAGRSRISRAGFCRVMAQRAAAGVLAERDPGQFYDALQTVTTDDRTRQVDALYMLAVFDHESTMGKAGVAAITHSWGNTREPNFLVLPVGATPGRSGTFPIWRDWMDGLKSTAARFTTSKWVYAARTTIHSVYDDPSGNVWAPAGDLNDPASYLRAVIDFMNQYADGGEPVMAGDDARFTWAPDTSEFGYPQGTRGRNGKPIDYLIIHVTEGTDSAAWLRGGNGSSVHYLTHRDATPREQQVAEADAAWTAGSAEYNLRGINIEFERFAADDWTDAEIANAVATCAPIIAHHNIPAVYLGRDNAGKRGIIGHMDVPDGNGGWGGSDHHTDPGGKFPWDKFVAGLQGSAPASGADPVTGKYIDTPFVAYFRDHGDVEIFGRPVTGSYIDPTTGLLTQFFERNVFELHPDGVKLRRLGAQAAAAAGFTGPGIP